MSLSPTSIKITQQQINEAIKLLYTTKESYYYRSSGICELVRNFIILNDKKQFGLISELSREDRWYIGEAVNRYLDELIREWPYRSSNRNYPVPSCLPDELKGNRHLDPEKCYFNERSYFDPKSPYGRARLNLLEFLYMKTQPKQ
jgi:hypothetical protein